MDAASILFVFFVWHRCHLAGQQAGAKAIVALRLAIRIGGRARERPLPPSRWSPKRCEESNAAYRNVYILK